jgi:hypothetical protein
VRPLAKAGEEQRDSPTIDRLGHGFRRAWEPLTDLVGAELDPES